MAFGLDVSIKVCFVNNRTRPDVVLTDLEDSSDPEDRVSRLLRLLELR